MTHPIFRCLILILFLLILISPTSLFCQNDDAINIDESDDIIEIPPVYVIARRIDNKPRHTLDSDKFKNATGSGGDPFRVLNLLPSVGVLNDFVGILSVRGGGPEDNLYYFDRLPLGYPYHLYGIVSTVNADVIQNVEVYPGGYGAEFGSDSQAVIDIYSHRLAASSFSGKFNLNMVYSQGFLEGNIGKRGYWYVFGRRSYMGPLFELLPHVLEIEDDLVTQIPSFWSYQGKFVYQLSRIHRIELNTIAADDSSELRFGVNEVSDSELRGPFKSENPFDSQGIHLYSELENKFKSVFSLTHSYSRNELAYGEGYYYRILDENYALRADLKYWVKFPKTLIESGFEVSNLPSSLTSIGSRPLEEGDWDYDFRIKKDGEKVHTHISKDLHRLEGYLQGTKDLFSSDYIDLYATLGLRASYFNLIDCFSMQPRGLIGATLGSEGNNEAGISLFPVDLRFMYGKYVQNPQFYQIVLGNENPELSPSLATHYVFTLKKDVTSDTRFEVAGYFKDLKDMITYDLSQKQYQNRKSGSVRGIEVSLEHKIGKEFRGWFAYSYTVSKRQDAPFEDERDYMYSTPHVLTINLNYFYDAIEFGANWQYKSGILYAPLDGNEKFTNRFTGKQTWIPIYGEPERTVPYHRLDLRFHWSFLNDISIHWLFLQIDKFNGGFTVELWNVYNRTNPLQVRYNSDFTKEVPIAQLPIVPFLAATFEF